MGDTAKFGLLRKVLKAIGLSEAAVNDLIDWITDRLADEQQEIGGEGSAPIFPYRTRDDFLSPAERSFYQVLRSVAGRRYLICPKVSLADLFFVKSGDPREYRVYTNKIDRKHVDFVLCNPETLAPLAGIELDDKSHQRTDRKQRDEFVDGVFSAAGLKLLRLRVQHGYRAQDLTAMLESVLPSIPEETVPASAPFPAVGQRAPSNSPPTNGRHDDVQESAAISPPVCTKCGTEMILRTAKKGSNQGKQFWGCPNFPRCRVVVPYERIVAESTVSV